MNWELITSDDWAGPAVFVNPMPARGVRRPRKPAKPAAKAPAKPKGLTVAALREMAKAAGRKVLSAHTKGELEAMLAHGIDIRPAAYDRQNAARKQARADAVARALCEEIARFTA